MENRQEIKDIYHADDVRHMRTQRAADIAIANDKVRELRRQSEYIENLHTVADSLNINSINGAIAATVARELLSSTNPGAVITGSTYLVAELSRIADGSKPARKSNVLKRAVVMAIVVITNIVALVYLYTLAVR